MECAEIEWQEVLLWPRWKQSSLAMKQRLERSEQLAV